MSVWAATCPDTLAPSYSALAARETGAVAAEMEQRKRVKYSHLDSSNFFAPVAVETLVTSSGTLAGESQQPLQTLQSVAMAVQRGSAAAILGTAERDSAVGYE